MTFYDVWYQRPKNFGRRVKIDPKNLDRTHILVKSVDADNLEQVFHEMQGEVWSPNGEARDMIRGLGLQHTSMSVGDVVAKLDEKVVYMVDTIGFKFINQSVDGT